MTGEILPRLAACAAVLAAGACERAAPTVRPPQTLAQTAADPALRAHVGASYSDFIVAPGMGRYGLAELPLSEAGRARLSHAMGVNAPSWTAEGGGAEALVFVGCAVDACAEAAGIVAIDLANGAVFAAVRDGQGRDVLLGNERLEALIEATSPADRWSDPSAWDDEAAPPAP